jgi:hypothetical protein
MQCAALTRYHATVSRSVRSLSELRLASGGHPLGLHEIQNAPLRLFRFGDEVIRRALPAIPNRRSASTME